MRAAGLDLGEQAAREIDLIDDLAGIEVALEAELGGRAELTVDRAADLRRDALRGLARRRG